MMCDDERQWTRLIDGELPFAEQRALLGGLDEAPDGWKRLALGLLEAETFRRELRTCAPPEPVAVVVPPGRAGRLVFRTSAVLLGQDRRRQKPEGGDHEAACCV